MKTNSPKIQTDKFSQRLRESALDSQNCRILITNFYGSQQEEDLTEPANCDGFGRVRHFQRSTGKSWPDNPLPIDPVSVSLGLSAGDIIRAQVFQNAVCNWRCWYCYVDFSLLSANPNHASWRTAAELVELYLSEPNPPRVLDLTGGQPDLTPEWIPWMMNELTMRGYADSVYVWSDDNLSNDYFWRYLSASERNEIHNYPHYGRVCCFKGFDEQSFSFNTCAEPELFNQQFELFRRLLTLDLDIYAYVTLTNASDKDLDKRVSEFVTRLQNVHPNLPLRTVPLEVRLFSPVQSRMSQDKVTALNVQYDVLACWNYELTRRFSVEERQRNIAHVDLSL